MGYDIQSIFFSLLFLLTLYLDSTSCAEKINGHDLLGDYFSIPQSVSDNRLMNPSRTDTATFVRNNTLYVWGGQGYYSTDEFFDIVPYFNAVSINATDPDQKTITYSFVNNSREYQNYAIGASAAVDPTNGNKALFFGGFRNNRWVENEDGPMYVEQYDFSNSRWTTIPSMAEDLNGTSIPAPRNRAYSAATAVARTGNIYVSGGSIGDENDTIDNVPIWMYNPTRQMFSPLQQNSSVIIAQNNETIYPFVLG